MEYNSYPNAIPPNPDSSETNPSPAPHDFGNPQALVAELVELNKANTARLCAPADTPQQNGDVRPVYLTDTMEACRQEQEGQAEKDDGATMLANLILAQELPATDRSEQPPPIRYIIRPQITVNTGISLFIGPGGSGKSYQALIRCIAIASGRPIGTAHQAEVTAHVCYFSLEDPPDVLTRRYYNCIAAIEEHYGPFSTGQLAALDANLHRYPVSGIMGSLMELDGKGNPKPTVNYAAMRGIIEKINPSFIVLDTMSRALGVDENNNAHAARWISALEQIIFDFPGTVFQIVGHTGKSKYDGKNEDPASIRGASAFAWNARAVEIYTKASDNEIESLGMEKGTEVLKLCFVKHNYSGSIDPIFFIRNEYGVPIEVNKDVCKTMKDRLDAQEKSSALKALITIIAAYPDGLHRSVLVEGRGSEIKEIRYQIKHTAGINLNQLDNLIDFGIETGELIQSRDEKSKARNKPWIIRAKGSQAGQEKKDEPKSEQGDLF